MSSGHEQDPEYASKEEMEEDIKSDLFYADLDTSNAEIYDDEEFVEEDFYEDGDEEIEVEDDAGAKFPHIHVKLVGEDGNVFAIMGRVRTALRRGGATMAEIEQYTEEMTNGDYNDALVTCIRWVTVE